MHQDECKDQKEDDFCHRRRKSGSETRVETSHDNDNDNDGTDKKKSAKPCGQTKNANNLV